MRVRIATCLALALSLSVGQAARADLLAFWNFNNTANDGDRLNTTVGVGNGAFQFMLDNNPNFDDGWYDQAEGRLYPSHDSFENYGGPDNGGFDPGALVDETAFSNGVGVPSEAVENAMFKAWINVSNLVGDGALSSSNPSAPTNDWGSFGGTTSNEPGTPFAGGSLVPIGSGNNGRSFTIEADLSGFEAIELSWAQRGTGTGYTSRQVAVSTDGVNFTNLNPALYGGTGGLGSSFAVQSVSFGSLLDNATTAYIRFTLNGAAVNGNGNNRFDNFVLEGTASIIEPPVVPEPGMMLVFGGLAVVFGAARKLRG